MRMDCSEKHIENLISQLKEKLIECMEENRSVAVHLHTGNVTVRMPIVPDEVNINKDEFCLEYKSVYFSLENKINHIKFIDDCEYDCYYIKAGDTEIFFDFV